MTRTFGLELLESVLNDFPQVFLQVNVFDCFDFRNEKVGTLDTKHWKWNAFCSNNVGELLRVFGVSLMLHISCSSAFAGVPFQSIPDFLQMQKSEVANLQPSDVTRGVLQLHPEGVLRPGRPQCAENREGTVHFEKTCL